MGILDYELFEATDMDSLEVTALLNSGFVKSFPPCFRCGRNRCACTNNVLMRQQIGNWCSFLNVLRDIVSHQYQLCLICEDDIQFTENYEEVINSLLRRDVFDSYGIDCARPLLIGIGRSFCADHVYRGDFHFRAEARMSNPCFMLNLEMARLLLAQLDQIRETSDMYIHKTIPARNNTVQYFTMMPSPVYELSTSVFKRFDSEIHPTVIDNCDAASAAKHRFRIEFKEILCIGHQRSGLDYASCLFAELGLEVGHDCMLENGLSSWVCAVEDGRYPFDVLGHHSLDQYFFACVVHIVRDPWEAIPDIVQDNERGDGHEECAFIKKHVNRELGIAIPDYDASRRREDKLALAVAQFIYWNQICERKPPDLFVRVESDKGKLVAYLKRHGKIDEDRVVDLSVQRIGRDRNRDDSNRRNCCKEPEPSTRDYRRLPEALLEGLREYCTKYDYPTIL